MKGQTGDANGGLSRREMLSRSACAAAVTALSRLPSLALANAAPRVGKEMVHEFPYGIVRLTGGLLKQWFGRIHIHYLALSNDRLLVALPAALKPVKEQSDSYVMSVNGKELVFVPYFDVQMESYNTYFRKA